MSKPPNDGNPSAAGISHLSGRRKKRRRGGRNSIAIANALESTESLPEQGFVSPGSGPERTISVTQLPSAQEKRRAYRHIDGSRPDALSRGNIPKFSNSNDGISRTTTTYGAKSAVGYGIDAKAEQKNKRKSGASQNNRRPGRRRNRNGRKIEFPPKPNRQNRGLGGGTGSYKKSARGGKDTESKNRPAHWSEVRNLSPLYAALDLGTNNCRLLVALPQQAGRFRVVDAFSRIVRLGKGMAGSGRLDENAMGRAVEALGECARKLQNSNIRKMRLIATEACRSAENGEYFLRRVKQETGLELEIVNRQTEAHLAAEGCGALVDKKADGAVLFDIGGGSSELILLDRRGRKNKRISEQISSWTSLPVGVVTLSEYHGGKDVSRQMFDAMVEEVEHHLSGFEGRENLTEFWHKGRVHLLGTSGTVTTLAGVHLKLPRYDRRQVDGIWLSDGEVDRAIEQLLEMEYHQRAANPCIGSERADLVLAGCAILQAIRKTWPSPRLRVADRGLREGILTQMMNQDEAWITPKKGRKSQASRVRRRNSRSRQGGRNNSLNGMDRDG